MKLRQLPEDFVVEEITSKTILKDKSNYKLYLIEKIDIEAFALLQRLSRENNIPFRQLGIAGLKDKHALTRQYITVLSKYSLKTVNEKNLRITFMGYTDNKMRLGDLEGNKFNITVRDITRGELDGISRKAKDIEKIGVPNYFDSQRFGSVIENKFIAKLLIKQDYEQAVKAYLTSFSKSERSSTKQEKRAILHKWDDLSKLKIQNRSLSTVVDEYLKKNDWLEAYKKIPPNIREIIVSAYQSYLWNECVKEVLKQKISRDSLYYVRYSIGSLLFYKSISEDEAQSMPLAFKTISDKMHPISFELDIIKRVLEKEGVSIDDFDIKEKTGNFFKTHERKILLNPSQFRISPYSADELNDRGKNNRFKVTLSFALPKGSYATIITKRIFGR